LLEFESADNPQEDCSMNSEADRFFENLSRPGPQEITIAGRLLRPGSRVRLKPQSGDMLDSILAGRVAVVEGIEHNDSGATYIAVILEDDPGRDLAATRHPARRYLFVPDEIEPVDQSIDGLPPRRVLVAGIGNVFLGDDGFGVAVAQRLNGFALPPEVEVADFGIRGLDLAYALGQPYDAVILVDIVPSDGCPGRLQLIEPDTDGNEAAPFDNHRVDPLAVLRLAHRMGELPPQIFLLGCEPMNIMDGESMSTHLSAPVAAAADKAVETVLMLVKLLLAGRRPDTDAVTGGNIREKKEPIK
jgi:hydrogenase maturation protease